MHRGSPLSPVAGTNLLHDETGKVWFSISGDALARAPSWGIDTLAGVTAEKNSQLLSDTRLTWAVGDESGPRYAYVESTSGPCGDDSHSLVIERSAAGWQPLDEAPQDRSPPIALTSSDLEQTSLYINVVNSCGHGGPPFDYELRTRGAPHSYPQPARITVPFMGGKQVFSAVAYAAHALTPAGDVLVLGAHRKLNAQKELDTDTWALETFRKGAKKSEVVPLAPDDEGVPETSTQFTLWAARTLERHAPGSAGLLDTCSYRMNAWWWNPAESAEDSAWYESEEQLFVDGAPFFAERRFRHAGLRFLVGTAGDLDVTLVEARAHSEGASSN